MELLFVDGLQQCMELHLATLSLAIGRPMWNTYDPLKNALAAHQEEELGPTPIHSAFGSDHYGLLNIIYSYQRTAC